MMSTSLRTPESDAAVARWVALTLRIGVFSASALIAVGLAIALTHIDNSRTLSLDEALGRHMSVHEIGPRSILRQVGDGQGTGLIMLGLLVLILTPTARVAITALSFIQRRETVMTICAVIVLVILGLGLVGIGH